MALDEVEVEVDVCGEGVRALADAVRELDQEYRQFRQRVAAASGISLAEFDALTAVTWSPGTVTPKRLAEVTRMTTGAVTALVDRLAAVDLLQRRPHPSDRRSVVIALTPSGQDLVEQIYRSYVRAFETMAVRTGPAAMRALVDSLGHLAEAVSHADDEFQQARHGRSRTTQLKASGAAERS